MGMFEAVIMLIMTMMPEEDAKHFVDPFFNPEMNPIAAAEKQSRVLDVEFQEMYGLEVDDGRNQEIKDARNIQRETSIDKYRDRRGVSAGDDD